MADFGSHSGECANADGGICHCDCKGTMHGVTHMGGKPRDMAGVTVTKNPGGGYLVARKDTGRPPGGGTRAERTAARAGDVKVTATSKPRHTLPPELVASVDKARASLPKTLDEWAEPLRDERALDKYRGDIQMYEDNIAGATLALREAEQDRDRQLKWFKEYYPNARMNRLSKFQRDALHRPKYRNGFGLDHIDEDIRYAQKNIADYQELLNNAREELTRQERMFAAGKLHHFPEVLIEGFTRAKSPMPPDAYQRHLDTVLDTGRRVLKHARQVIKDDPEYRRLSDQLDEAHKRYQASNQHDTPADEFVAALRAWKAAKRAPGRREQEILHELLSSARSFGENGHHDIKLVDKASDSPLIDQKPARGDTREVLAKAERFYPSDWLKVTSGRPLTIGTAERAWYDRHTNHLMMPVEERGQTYEGAHGDGPAGEAVDVTVHEMGHRMEGLIPGLTHLEFTFVKRRSTKVADDGAVTIEATRPVYAHTPNEFGYPDRWAGPYAGKTYEGRDRDNPHTQSWEVFQVGTQDLWSRRTDYDTSDELQEFVIGALLTVG